jgi:hypothetical protein
MEALERKLNEKKLLSLNFMKNNLNLKINNNNNYFNTNFDNDSPSNKILSLKILTFGHNCNFPGENLEEEFDLDSNNEKLKNIEANKKMIEEKNVNRINKSLKVKQQEEIEKKKKAEIVVNLVDNKGKLLNKKIAIVNKQEEKSKESNITDLKAMSKRYE